MNKQMNPEAILAENRELKKELHELRGRLLRSSGAPTPTMLEAESGAITGLRESTEASSMILSLRNHWIVLVVSVHAILLCFVNAAVSAH